MMSYANYLYIAIRAAVDAGKSIMDIYNDPESDFGIERKADNSPLTKADKAAHRLITNALSVTPFPVLSEEGKEIPFKERSKWETLWIVDPLDGTKEFIKRNYQEKRGVYREYRLGGERCARVGRHLCARPEGVVFRLLLCGCL